MAHKKFNIILFITILLEQYKKWDAPVITLMANKYTDPFFILVATILSLRTKDEVTAKAAFRLFEIVKTPEELLKTDEQSIQEAIYPAGFYKTKAKRLKQISKIIIEKYDNKVPDTMEKLLSLPGVGRKTANLVLIEGFKKNGICVDTHVHRISNRIKYVKTKTPDETEFALRKKLPKKYWIKYNEILVAFGQTICRPISPFCSKCPVSFMCSKNNVKLSR
jgi:endonuclease-3